LILQEISDLNIFKRVFFISHLFWLSEFQMDRLRLLFPKSHGRPHVDTVLCAGLVWVYLIVYLPHWQQGMNNSGFLVIDATHLKAHKAASSLKKRVHLPA